LAKANEIENDLRSGRKRSKGEQEYATFVESWYRKRKHLARSTRARDESHIRTHLLPRWGSYRLVDIDVDDVEDWVFELDGELARKTLNDVFGIFRRSMDVAFERRYIPHIPYPRRLDLRDKPTPVKEYFYDEEALWSFADAMPPHWRA
jgi:hypothetical protein